MAEAHELSDKALIDELVRRGVPDSLKIQVAAILYERSEVIDVLSGTGEFDPDNRPRAVAR